MKPLDDAFMEAIQDATAKDKTSWLMSQAVVELHRIANAQERMVELAETDLTAQVEEIIKARAEERAVEIVAEKTKRTFLGKR